MNLHRTLGCSLLLIALLVQAWPADAASPRSRARALFKAGNALYTDGDYEGALAKYQAARALYPNYKIDLNIAYTLDDLKRPAEAIKEFERFLEAGGDSAPAEVVRKARARMEALKAQLEQKQQQQQAAAAAVAAREKAARQAKKDRAARAKARAAAESRRQHGRRKLHTTVAWSTLGLGAASLVTAGVLYGVGLSSRGEAYDRYSAARAQAEIDAHWADVEHEEKKLIAGHVLAGVGAAAVGVSLYFFLTRPEARERAGASPRGPRLVLSATGEGAGLQLSGVF